MKLTSITALSASVALALTLTQPALVRAQDAQPAAPAASGNNNNNGGGRRGNFNPEEFRKQMAERVKTSLKASDDEWKVLEPLIEKAQTAQRGTGGGFRGGYGGGRGGNNAGGGGTPAAPASDRPRTESEQTRDALREVLQNESSSPAEIKAKLTALRESHKKSAAELTAAREELRKVVTARQEAVLVSMGLLD